MMHRQMPAVVVAGAALMLGLGIFGGSPRQEPETRQSSQVEKRVRKMEQKLNSLEDKIDRLSRKLTVSVTSFDRRLRRLERLHGADSEGAPPPPTSERNSQEKGDGDTANELSPRVKKLYQPEKVRGSTRVKGLSYQLLQRALRNTTKDGREELAEAVQGRVVSWSGWVRSVKTSGQESQVIVNMYEDTETYPGATVSFAVPARVGERLKKGEQIQFSGRIKSVDPEFGEVTLMGVSIRL